MDMEREERSNMSLGKLTNAWPTAIRDPAMECYLSELPEELILKIMCYLDPASLYFIRQVSTFFARLFSDRLFEEFSHSRSKDKSLSSYMPREYVRFYYDEHEEWLYRRRPTLAIQTRTLHFISRVAQAPYPIDEDSYQIIRNGGPPRPPYHFDGDFRFPEQCSSHDRCQCWRKVSEMLQGRLCEACSSKNRVDYEECAKEKLSAIYCAGCRIEHAQMWFSPTQLRKGYPKNGNGPRCISWEGRVRLCPHRHFNWADIQGWISQTGDAKQLAGACKDGDTLFQCHRCFGKDISVQQQRPGVRFFQHRSRGSPARLEMSWRMPLSAVTNDVNNSETKKYDEMLCPHLTFSDGPDCILGGIWQDGLKGYITCKTCGFRCYWRRRNSWSETQLRGRFFLWRGSGCRRQGEASRLWMLMDSSSYEWDESGRHTLWCQNKGCRLAKGDYRMKLHDDQQKSAFPWSRPQTAFDAGISGRPNFPG